MEPPDSQLLILVTVPENLTSWRLTRLFLPTKTWRQLGKQRSKSFDDRTCEDPGRHFLRCTRHERKRQKLWRGRPADLLQERSNVVPAEPRSYHQAANHFSRRRRPQGDRAYRATRAEVYTNLIRFGLQDRRHGQRIQLRRVCVDEVSSEQDSSFDRGHESRKSRDQA